MTCLNASSDAPSYSRSSSWRELTRRPDSAEEARAIIAGIREQQVDRLTRLLAEHEQLAAEEAVELPDRAAFDPSPGFERHRRYRTALGRELLRTLDTLRKLRKDGRQMADMGYDSDRVIEEEQTDKIGPVAGIVPRGGRNRQERSLVPR